MNMSNTNQQSSTYVCKIVESTVFIEEMGNVIVYGINMYNSNKELAELDGEHCCIEDISEDFEKVERLRKLLVEYDVYPVHLKDIVEDFLAAYKVDY